MAITTGINHFDSIEDKLCLYIFRQTGEISALRGVCHRFKELVEGHAAAIESDITDIFGNFSFKCVANVYCFDDSSALEKIECLFKKVKELGLKPKSTALRALDPYHLIHLKPLFDPYVKLEHMVKFWYAVREKAPLQLQNKMDVAQPQIDKMGLHADPLKVMWAMKKCLIENAKELALIEDLNLSGKLLCFIPDEIGLFVNLKSLDLSNNRLSKLSAKFAQLKNLQTLDLSQNRFTSIPDELNDLKELQTLNIAGNRLDPEYQRS